MLAQAGLKLPEAVSNWTPLTTNVAKQAALKQWFAFCS